MNKWIVTFSICLLGLHFSAFAGSVIQSKNGKVILDITGEDISVGDQLYLLNESDKRVAIIEVTQVKNDKGLAVVKKGKAAVGYSIQKSGSKSSGSSSSSASSKESSIIRFDQFRVAVQLKALMNKISAKQQDNTSPFPNQETVDMAGTNFGISVTGDYAVNSFLVARASVGLETLDIAGTAQYNSCASKTSKDCNVQVNYLTGGAYARYDIIKSKFNPWVAAGGTLKFPITKKSTALDEGGLQMANTMAVLLGVDYHLNNKTFLPFSFEYHVSTNKSDTVPTIDQMALTFGYGMKF